MHPLSKRSLIKMRASHCEIDLNDFFFLLLSRKGNLISLKTRISKLKKKIIFILN